MRDRDLDGFNVQLFRELDGVLDGLASLAWQAENKVAVHDQAELVAVLGELAGMLQGRTLFDVLQNLLIAGFVPDDK